MKKWILVAIGCSMFNVAKAHDEHKICNWSLTVGIYAGRQAAEQNPFGDYKLACEVGDTGFSLVPWHHRSSVPQTGPKEGNSNLDYYGIEYKISF